MVSFRRPKDSSGMVLALLGLGIVAIFVLVLVTPYLLPGCTTCGWQWQSVGRITSVKTGDIMDFGGKISSFNTNIQASGKTVISLDKYQNCQFDLSKVEYYRQNGKQYVAIHQGKDRYIEEYGSGSTLFKCTSGAQVRLKPTPVSCSLATNPDPLAYEDYQICQGLASIEIYINVVDIRNVECTSGQTKSKSCEDGSKIITAQCVNNLYVSTNNKCPVVSGTGNGTTGGSSNICTNSCPINYTRTTYPECKCNPPQQVSGVCAPGEVFEGQCADGSKVVTHSCQSGQYAVTNNSCPVQDIPEQEDSGIWIIVGLVLIGIVIAGGMGLILGKRRK